MSKWIDYDAIDYKHYQLHDKSDEFLNGVVYMAQRIEEAPTIDIVRCKECRYWEMRNSPRGWCVVHQGYVSPQYFCADGERKESDDA